MEINTPNYSILDDIISSDISAMHDFLSHNIQDHEVTAYASNLLLRLVRAGGKRIRPKLVFIICKMLQYFETNRIQIAASVECIHYATLLHDDVLDDSEIRHGIQTAHIIWGNKASILAGDLLLTLAFRWLIDCNNINILRILSQASHALVKGEIKQMTECIDLDLMHTNYFAIIGEKTASLFSACCEAISTVSTATQDEIYRLKNFGFNFGMAFQIIDDILDYTAYQDSYGKKVGKDFHDRKVTLPVIIAYEKGNIQQRKFWKEYFYSNERNFDQAWKYIAQHHAIYLSIQKAQYYLNIAQDNLNDFPHSLYKSALITFIKSSINRET
ncbi:polyprenyl synthetase family protein [Wolbachia endosymbiont of Howardula sp.]|uniref:polyprenyl synthetase family protein n=1 Tax=Wolbachia endosymbiont of Howardula sp. TaxID=2916816 RepID=UPI00217DC851|nr:polyprenyl synthetase family protein [Wolbachia endosymbiont of Howardula sp.]UWI82957.1 polyprenyl synthetase family protein [Wolbachia endosymbiont of Howardula sp.]